MNDAEKRVRERYWRAECRQRVVIEGYAIYTNTVTRGVRLTAWKRTQDEAWDAALAAILAEDLTK